MGTMLGEDEDDSASLDSDSDLILDGNNAGTNSDDDDELEVNEMAAASLRARKSAKPQTTTAPLATATNSDEDFWNLKQTHFVSKETRRSRTLNNIKGVISKLGPGKTTDIIQNEIQGMREWDQILHTTSGRREREDWSERWRIG